MSLTIYTKEEYSKLITDALNNGNAFDKCKDIKNKELYIILINGKRIILSSRKSIFNGKGPAKIALRYHIDSFLRSKVNTSYIRLEKQSKGSLYAADFLSTKKFEKEVQDEWIKKHVAIIPFSEWYNIQKKLTK